MTAIRIHLRVNAINSAQNIVSTPITQAGQGQAYIYEVLARDPENNPITYSLKTAPNGMTINANSGRITWTANSAGSYDISVQATDSKGAFNIQTYKLDVITNPINHAPSITSTPKFLADTNSPYSYQVVATDR